MTIYTSSRDTTGRRAAATLPRLRRIAKQCCEALAFVHNLNLIHCDLKPENILIRSYSRCEVKVIDFGSSCRTTDHLSSYVQSRSYRAPEVILGLPYDGKIDMWSLGAILAELLTGYVLFQNDSVAAMLARISSVVGPYPEGMLRKGRHAHKYFVDGVVYERDRDDCPSCCAPARSARAATQTTPSFSRSWAACSPSTPTSGRRPRGAQPPVARHRPVRLAASGRRGGRQRTGVGLRERAGDGTVGAPCAPGPREYHILVRQ